VRRKKEDNRTAPNRYLALNLQGYFAPSALLGVAEGLPPAVQGVAFDGVQDLA